jgi:transposase-like protein
VTAKPSPTAGAASVLDELQTLCERRDEEVRAKIAQAVDAGARSEDVAQAIGVSRSTLWRRYRRELSRAAAVESELRLASPDRSGSRSSVGRTPRRAI